LAKEAVGGDESGGESCDSADESGCGELHVDGDKGEVLKGETVVGKPDGDSGRRKKRERSQRTRRQIGRSGVIYS
jgi:hypothetical protein